MLAQRIARWVVALVVATTAGAGGLAGRTPSALAAPAGKQYYVDSNLGSDDNAGTGQAAPWRSLGRLSAVALAPGDTVNLAAGSEWRGPLVIEASGSAQAPITFRSYGSGARPTIYDPAPWGIAIDVRGSYVEVVGLLVRDTHYIGISIERDASHSTIRDCEAVRVGVGFAIFGNNNLVTQSYAHDLTIVTNTVGGDDDFGAIGVMLRGSDNEVSYNLLVRCQAPSYDYGVDGGGIEWYGNVNGAYVHHNWVADSAGMLEVGGGSAIGAVVAYNVSVNNGTVTYFHLTGDYASDVRAFRFENNTVVDTEEQAKRLVFGFDGEPRTGTLIARNNIFYVLSFSAVALTGAFTHDHNLYWLGSGDAAVGFELGAGERVADPRFMDLEKRDFRLQRSSPARAGGADLGYHADFAGRQLLRGVAPDLGAYQYASRLAVVCPLVPGVAALLCQAWSDSAGRPRSSQPMVAGVWAPLAAAVKRGRQTAPA